MSEPPADPTRDWLTTMGQTVANSAALAKQVADLNTVIELAKHPNATIRFVPGPAHMHDPTAPAQTTPM